MKHRSSSNLFIFLWLWLIIPACAALPNIKNSQKEIPAGATVSALVSQFEQSPSENSRLAALNQLATLDPPATVQLLSHALPQIDSWPLLTRACELAVQFNDPTLIDPLIQSLARPATTFTRRDRPEARALEYPGNQKLEPLLQSRLLTSPKIPARVAAMDLLCELQSPAQVTQLILASPASSKPPDDFLLSLQWWVQTFDNLPHGLQETLWVETLHRSATEPWLLRAIARHQKLRPESDYTIAPRFVALLANVNESYLPLTRAQLLADIQQKLAPHKTTRRPPSYPGAPDDYQPTLAAQEENLSRCDLLAIETLLDSLASPGFTREILTLGNADRLDPTTEHGGLLTFREASLWPIGYPPLYTGRDTAYITSDSLLADTPLGLAQFHFHFQQPQNESHAGPGRGDLDYIHQTPCTAVVFTSISTTSFDATYYTPSGAVLDLGIWRTETP